LPPRTSKKAYILHHQTTNAGRRDSARELVLQTTLLGLAIAIILALVAALAGPLLIDWGGYRSIFEAEASHLIGVDMRVTGAIEARLLPAPRLVLHDIELGGSDDKVGARALSIEFALGPLMRGQWHASELQLSGAKLRLGLDAAGHVHAPNVPINFSPDSLSIDRLGIDDANITLTDTRSGAKIVIDKLWFNGEARSLLGPFSGEGAATLKDELYPFRVSTGRADEDGAIKLHLNVDPVTRPLSIEADGLLAVSGGAPTFDGTLNLARPVGIASARAASVMQPWRINGKLKVTAESALMPLVEFQYGSEEQGFKLTGTVDFKFGKTPRFEGVLSGRQIDVDRALVAETGQSQPATVLRNLAALAGAAFRPSIPVQLGVGIDRITLGGNTVENLRGDISTRADGWSLDRFEFRAPGFTQVRLSGELATDTAGATFKGPAEIEAGDPKAFAAWIEGGAAPGQSELRPLRLRGDVAFSADRFSIERLSAEFERKTVTGRLLYSFAAGNRPARLETDLAAPELDVDAVLNFGKALLAGSSLQLPQEMLINATIGHASFAGIHARDAVARVNVDGSGLQIDRLSVADLGGNSFSASGQIDTGGRTPQGSLVLDLDARQPASISALAARFSSAGNPAAGALDRVGRAKLHATLDVAGDKDGATTTARLTVAGDLDTMHVDAKASASGDWNAPYAANVQVNARLDAADGKALLSLTGIDGYMIADKGPGQLTLELAGAVNRAIDGSWRMSGSGLNLGSRVAIGSNRVVFSDIDAKMGGSDIRGRLAVNGGSPRRIEGALDADTIEAASVLAAAIGLPSFAAANEHGWSLPAAPFAGGMIGDVSGQVALKVRRVGVTPRLALREFSATMRFDKNGVVFDDIVGEMARGRAAGSVAFRSTDSGLSVHGKVALTGADAASLLPAAARPPVSGSVDLDTDLEGVGFSPAALVGSLHGNGTIALNNGQLAQLEPRLFDNLARAVDNGLPPDGAKMSGLVNQVLDGGRFPVKHAETTIAVSAGQARLNNLQVSEDNAELSFVGTFDLTDGAIDARLTLSGPKQVGGAGPDVFVALSGPLSTPVRTVDASGLAGWLTLRAIENQSKRIKAMENTAQSMPASAPVAQPVAKKKEAPALPAPLTIKPLPVSRQAPKGSLGAQK
jgi:uncharacterized protein involved in outer membrane biogenesis